MTNSIPNIIINIPEGEQFGFPRVLPRTIEPKDLEDWIVDCGYPRTKIYEYGDAFTFEYWLEEL